MKTISQFRGPYFFLSNFYYCPVMYQGIEYPSSENAYQSAKSDDQGWKIICRYNSKPKVVKAQGRTIKLIADWENKKVGIMEEILRIKFSNPALKKLLLDTGDMHLQEGNWWHDKFWGIDFQTGEGENVLGKLLMKIRNEIKREERE